jgi:hypothetical protein
MIKVRIQLDGNEYGYLTYTCKETIEQYQDYVANSPTSLIALTEAETGALITIPLRRYVVEAWVPDE